MKALVLAAVFLLGFLGNGGCSGGRCPWLKYCDSSVIMDTSVAVPYPHSGGGRHSSIERPERFNRYQRTSNCHFSRTSEAITERWVRNTRIRRSGMAGCQHPLYYAWPQRKRCTGGVASPFLQALIDMDEVKGTWVDDTRSENDLAMAFGAVFMSKSNSKVALRPIQLEYFVTKVRGDRQFRGASTFY